MPGAPEKQRTGKGEIGHHGPLQTPHGRGGEQQALLHHRQQPLVEGGCFDAADGLGQIPRRRVLGRHGSVTGLLPGGEPESGLALFRHTQKSVGITTVYVTHDQEEAMAISDRIAVMKDGVIQHVGTPRDIYQRPKNVFVATFIGRTNIVNAHVKDGIITFADGYHEHIDALDKAAEQDVRCSIRPEEFIICKDGTDGIHGTVQECTYLGLNTHYTIDTDQGDSVEIVEESSIGEGLKKGEKVLLKVKKEKINVFTKDGGTNLIRSDAYEKQ